MRLVFSLIWVGLGWESSGVEKIAVWLPGTSSHAVVVMCVYDVRQSLNELSLCLLLPLTNLLAFGKITS